MASARRRGAEQRHAEDHLAAAVFCLAGAAALAQEAATDAPPSRQALGDARGLFMQGYYRSAIEKYEPLMGGDATRLAATLGIRQINDRMVCRATSDEDQQQSADAGNSQLRGRSLGHDFFPPVFQRFYLRFTRY